MIIGNLKFKAYFELLYLLWVVDIPQNCKGASLSVFGYHWLPLATIELVGDNREYDVKGIF